MGIVNKIVHILIIIHILILQWFCIFETGILGIWAQNYIDCRAREAIKSAGRPSLHDKSIARNLELNKRMDFINWFDWLNWKKEILAFFDSSQRVAICENSEQLFKQAFHYRMNRNLMLQALFMLHRKTVAHYFVLLHGVKEDIEWAEHMIHSSTMVTSQFDELKYIH